MNKHGIVEIAIFCHAGTPCAGVLTLLAKPSKRSRAATATVGHTSFSIAAHHTGKVRVHLSALGQRLIRKARRSLSVKASLSPTPLTAAVDGAATQLISLRGAQHRH